MHDCNLKIRNIIVLAIALTPLRPLHAQDDCGDEYRVNSLRERTSDPLDPEFCVGHREVHDEA